MAKISKLGIALIILGAVFVGGLLLIYFTQRSNPTARARTLEIQTDHLQPFIPQETCTVGTCNVETECPPPERTCNTLETLTSVTWQAIIKNSGWSDVFKWLIKGTKDRNVVMEGWNLLKLIADLTLLDSSEKDDFARLAEIVISQMEQYLDDLNVTDFTNGLQALYFDTTNKLAYICSQAGEDCLLNQENQDFLVSARQVMDDGINPSFSPDLIMLSYFPALLDFETSQVQYASPWNDGNVLVAGSAWSPSLSLFRYYVGPDRVDSLDLRGLRLGSMRLESDPNRNLKNLQTLLFYLQYTLNLIPLTLSIGTILADNTTQGRMCKRIAQAAWMLDCLYYSKMNFPTITSTTETDKTWGNGSFYTHVIRDREPYQTMGQGAVLLKFTTAQKLDVKDIFIKTSLPLEDLIYGQVMIDNGCDACYVFVEIRDQDSGKLYTKVRMYIGTWDKPGSWSYTDPNATYFNIGGYNQTMRFGLPPNSKMVLKYYRLHESAQHTYLDTDFEFGRRAIVKNGGKFSLGDGTFDYLDTVLPYEYLPAFPVAEYVNKEEAFQTLRQVDPCETYTACELQCPEIVDLPEDCYVYADVVKSMYNLVQQYLQVCLVNLVVPA
uniref:Uncharacterized protein n=1 Tax=viral metagenome TaxID=1070528 RepID=A0A6C0BN79_9ZZZZ